jgi:hypothetical protein
VTDRRIVSYDGRRLSDRFCFRLTESVRNISSKAALDIQTNFVYDWRRLLDRFWLNEVGSFREFWFGIRSEF